LDTLLKGGIGGLPPVNVVDHGLHAVEAGYVLVPIRKDHAVLGGEDEPAALARDGPVSDGLGRATAVLDVVGVGDVDPGAGDGETVKARQ
jgi:hypothetical protein